MLDEQVLASFKARAAQAGRIPCAPERWTLPVGNEGIYVGKADPTSAEMLAE